LRSSDRSYRELSTPVTYHAMAVSTERGHATFPV
jgi:hypothetical protein